MLRDGGGDGRHADGEIPLGRPVYRHADLRSLLHPASIAIIGASPRQGAFGERTLNNLQHFAGRIGLINPRYDHIGERPCAPSLQALGFTPDCAVIALPTSGVEQALGECVAAGVRGAIVYASGYAETGRLDGIEAQQRLEGIVRGTATKLLGPNTLGFSNLLTLAHMMFGRVGFAQPGNQWPAIGVISQSGALGMALGQAVERGGAVSHMLSAGNASDVTIADLISYLAEDPQCHAIACVLEGIPSLAQLREAAAIVRAAGKPLVLYKSGQLSRGADAARSHTASVIGDFAAWRAVLEPEGAVFVNDLEAVMETAVFLAKAGRPKGAGVVTITTSGGAGVIAADKSELWNVPAPQPTESAVEALRQLLPEFAAFRNPCDVTAQVLNDDGPLRATAEILLGDPQYGAAVVPHPYADTIGLDRIRLWDAVGAALAKPICYVWNSEWLEGTGVREAEASRHLSLFRSTTRCFATLAAWQRREAFLRNAGDVPDRIEIGQDARTDAAALLAGAPDGAIGERFAKKIAQSYGIPVVADIAASNSEDAIRAAERIGYPVVMKLDNAAVAHKSEVGGVKLGLLDAVAVGEAFSAIASAAERHGVACDGVILSPMLKGGIELMVGGRVDEQAGPLVTVGLGGVYVELFRDVVIAPAPIGLSMARHMLEDLRCFPALCGARGKPAVDLDRLTEIVARASELIADAANGLSEIDINPLICSGGDICAVDAMIIKGRGA